MRTEVLNKSGVQIRPGEGALPDLYERKDVIQVRAQIGLIAETHVLTAYLFAGPITRAFSVLSDSRGTVALGNRSSLYPANCLCR